MKKQLWLLLCGIAAIHACSNSETSSLDKRQEFDTRESLLIQSAWLTDTFKVRKRTSNTIVSLDSMQAQTPPTFTGIDVVELQPDVPPQFNGGEAALRAYLKKKCVYPLVAFQNEVSGVVTVGFRICADGTIEGVKVKRSVGFGCDEMAVDVVKNMPIWIPGTKSGKNVKCPVVLDVPCGR